MIRRIAATIAAGAMLLVLAVPVMAGGWAEIEADAAGATQPTEGTPTKIGFTVLQHGVTPAPWETATVTFTDTGTGATFDVVATNDREDGHFIATATLPNAGYWSWQVTLANLESQHVPVRMTVLTADGKQPQFDPSSVLTAIDRAKIDVTNSMSERFAVDIERLDRQDEGYRARIDNLTALNRELTAELDGMQTKVASLETAGALPMLAVIMLSVLAGATAGFIMAWLAGRQSRTEPVVALNPAKRGADPV